MLPEDQLRVISALLICVPLSYLMQKMRLPVTRKSYSLIVGLLLQYWIYRTDLIYPLMMHCAVYGLIVLLGRKCGFIVTVFSLVTLSVYQMYLMIYYYGIWKIDVSVVLMTSVCKYSLFAYAYEDGGR